MKSTTDLTVQVIYNEQDLNVSKIIHEYVLSLIEKEIEKLCGKKS